MGTIAPTGPIRLGQKVPDFEAETTQGTIKFHEQIEGVWAVVFAFPDDFTPVATTELAAFSLLQAAFAQRSVKLFALSTRNTLIDTGKFESHQTWVKDINDLNNENLLFPIINDKDGKISQLFNVLGERDAAAVASKEAVGRGLAFKSRTVFIVDAQKQFRLIFNYPAAVGINTSEVLRVIDCLQTAATADVQTPANWIPGTDAIVPPNYDDEEAKRKFPGYQTLKPYLRLTNLAVKDTNIPTVHDKISGEDVSQFLNAALQKS